MSHLLRDLELRFGGGGDKITVFPVAKITWTQLKFKLSNEIQCWWHSRGFFSFIRYIFKERTNEWEVHTTDSLMRFFHSTGVAWEIAYVTTAGRREGAKPASLQNRIQCFRFHAPYVLFKRILVFGWRPVIEQWALHCSRVRLVLCI